MTEETPRLPAIRIRSDTRLTRHSFTPRSVDIMWSSGTTPKQNRDKKSILGSVFYEAKGNNGFVDFAIDDRPLTNGCARLPQLMGILGGEWVENIHRAAWFTSVESEKRREILPSRFEFSRSREIPRIRKRLHRWFGQDGEGGGGANSHGTLVSARYIDGGFNRVRNDRDSNGR